MKKLLIFIGIGIVCVGVGYMLTYSSYKDALSPLDITSGKGDVVTVTESNSELSFEYEGGEDGFMHTVLTRATIDHPDFVAGYTIMNAKEYQILTESTEPREGPESISILVFAQSGGEDVLMWGGENRAISLLDPEAQTREVLLAGIPAYSYSAPGLYPIDARILSFGDFIYVLHGAYDGAESAVGKEFARVLDSLTFIEEEPEPSLEEVTVTGTIVSVSTDAAAYDGPVEIVLLTGEGAEMRVSVPSMGLPLCKAYELIDDPFSLTAGQSIRVRGSKLPDGSIMPCSESDHFLEVVGVDEETL